MPSSVFENLTNNMSELQIGVVDQPEEILDGRVHEIAIPAVVTGAASAHSEVEFPLQGRVNESLFLSSLQKVNRGSSVNKDGELATLLHQHLGGDGHGADGWCSLHAFNTHLLCMGRSTEELTLLSEYEKNNAAPFGNAVIGRFDTRYTDQMTVRSEEGDTYGSMKEKVAKKIQETTSTGESVLLSISYGAHWFTAYNDGTRIWFLDSQQKIGFNLYDSEEVPLDTPVGDEEITIFPVTAEDRETYDHMLTLMKAVK